MDVFCHVASLSVNRYEKAPVGGAHLFIYGWEDCISTCVFKKPLICVVEKGFLPNPRKVFEEGFCS